MRMKEVHWTKEDEQEQQRVNGVRKHKNIEKAAYSTFTAYLRSQINLRREDRAETASKTLSWLFQGLFSCPT